MLCWTNRTCKHLGSWTLALSLASGCHHSRPDAHYLGEASESYYRDTATKIDYPAVNDPIPPEVTGTEAPRTIRDRDETIIRDIVLAEAVHLSLTNSQIIRTGGTFLSPGNPLLTNPDRISSVYDPAIQNSGVLFGGRGVEAALSAFDTQLNASMIWNRDERIANNPFFGGVPGSTFVTEGAGFNASLQKTFAYGGSLSIGHDVNYNASNVNPANVLFRSAYDGNVGLQYRQPLLAGAGTEFTRIAGPIGQQFGGLTGVSQGVIIARINNDIALSDFENSVHNLLRDVENAYWNLYLAYRAYHTAKTAQESSLDIWNYVNRNLEAGALSRLEMSQTQDQLFGTEAATTNAWSQVLTREIELRRLLGLPANDGTMLRPVDEPATAELIPDWYSSLTEALNQRVELRRQKWNLKSLELQLRAARSLTRPRLDLVGGYTVNGFGDQLLAYDDNDAAGTAQGLNSFYETISQGNQTGWNVGVQMNMPLGFRSAHAQVENYELRLAKAQKILQEQEKEISLELAASFQEVARAYQAMEYNLNRFLAAEENVKVYEDRREIETVDMKLRSVLRKADAEIAFYQSVVDYNKALTDLQFRKGNILHHNNILLSEGAWEVEAYADAKHHADSRAHAWQNDFLHHEPEAFASPVPVNGVQFTAPGAAIPAEPAPVPEQIPTPTPEAATAAVDPAGQAAPPPPVEQVAPAPPPQSRVPVQPQGATASEWVSPVGYESSAPAAREMPRPVEPVTQPAQPVPTVRETPRATPSRAPLNKGGSAKQ